MIPKDTVLCHCRIVLFASLMLCMSLFIMGCLDSGGGGKLGSGHDFGENTPDLVLAMGDSITAGGYSGGAPWPARFGGMVGKSVINDGIPGASSPVGAARANSLIVSQKPGFVIIFYGANDAITGVSADIFENSIRAMVEAAQNNQAIPVLATILQMDGGRAIYNGRVDRLNARIRDVASQLKVKVVDVSKAVRRDPALYLADGLHLSDEGELLVAMRFMDAFN